MFPPQSFPHRNCPETKCPPVCGGSRMSLETTWTGCSLSALWLVVSNLRMHSAHQCPQIKCTAVHCTLTPIKIAPPPRWGKPSLGPKSIGHTRRRSSPPPPPAGEPSHRHTVAPRVGGNCHNIGTGISREGQGNLIRPSLSLPPATSLTPLLPHSSLPHSLARSPSDMRLPICIFHWCVQSGSVVCVILGLTLPPSSPTKLHFRQGRQGTWSALSCIHNEAMGGQEEHIA